MEVLEYLGRKYPDGYLSKEQMEFENLGVVSTNEKIFTLRRAASIIES